MEKNLKEKLFTSQENRILKSLSAALGLRQIGLLLVLPFLATWAGGLDNATPALIGIAMGIFGLTQGMLQIPLGLWSDRSGRKVPFIAGMLAFTIGLLLGYFADSISMLILARALQGGGAVAAVIYSWIGDAIPAEKRNRAMSVPGIAVGISSAIALIGGPFLIRIITVEQMFLVCAVFSAAAVIYIIFRIPSGAMSESAPFSVRDYIAATKRPGLLPLYVSGMIMNYSLVAVFYILPQLIAQHMTREDTWMVLGPSVLAGMAVMRAAAKAADAGKTKMMLLGSYCLTVAAGMLLMVNGVPAIFAAAVVFFSGYMTQSTLLPSAITKMVGPESRGTVIGAHNALTCCGSFIGGALTGALWGISPALSSGAMILISLYGAFFLWTSFKESMTQSIQSTAQSEAA